MVEKNVRPSSDMNSPFEAASTPPTGGAPVGSQDTQVIVPCSGLPGSYRYILPGPHCFRKEVTWVAVTEAMGSVGRDLHPIAEDGGLSVVTNCGAPLR